MLTGPEAFVISDGIQPGYGGLGAHLIAREASQAEKVPDGSAVVALLGKLHKELLARDYFPRHWGVTPDSYRLPGATMAGARVNPWLKDSRLLLFNVGDAIIFYSADGQRMSLQSITDRTETGMLTQAIGGGPPGEPRPHWTALPLARRNRVLLSSDGLVDSMRRIEEIDRLVRSAESPKVAAQGLMTAAVREGQKDDVSVLVLDVNYVESESVRRVGGQKRGR